MKEFEQSGEFKNPPSDLFREIACNVVDFFNLTQECCGSKTRMEYPMSETKQEFIEGEEQRLKRESLLAMKNNDLFQTIDWGADDDHLELFKKVMVDFIIDYEIPTE